MGWEALIPLILQYGIPVAEKVWQLAATKSEPTQADWDALKLLAAVSAKDQVLAAITRNNIPVDSQLAKDMLAAAGA